MFGCLLRKKNVRLPPRWRSWPGVAARLAGLVGGLSVFRRWIYFDLHVFSTEVHGSVRPSAPWMLLAALLSVCSAGSLAAGGGTSPPTDVPSACSCRTGDCVSHGACCVTAKSNGAPSSGAKFTHCPFELTLGIMQGLSQCNSDDAATVGNTLS